MRKVKIDYDKLQNYFNENSDKTLIEVYTEIKKKKLRERTNEEILIFSYLTLNKKKLGLK